MVPFIFNILLHKNGIVFTDGYRHNVNATITDNPEVHRMIKNSVGLLNQKLLQGETVYGVNTGFGGSADTRTTDYVTLQKALIQHHNAAILHPTDRGQEGSHMAGLNSYSSHRMTVPVVRAAMLTRCNSLIRGHSAVRSEVIEYILSFLRSSMTPIVPLRGSISASGDLTPLAYIAGALEGNPDISVHVQRGKREEIIRADQALSELGLKPLELGPKEGLGLLNGTAFSSGAASLVLFEASQLMLLSQILTAMGTEALAGKISNYHPFISAARPHEGQIEAAMTIFNFLGDSKLAIAAGPGHAGLAQDRYALRTSTQWIGPQIERMALALKQVQTELNSTTDNPLINPADGHIYHGGNFQAASITAAMETTLSVAQMIGKMIFSQCSELLNPMLSHGLPPNLCMDDPSLSYAFKGIDINMASYISELGYLNHPVSNHVQSAEMHNQSINSLAFISCRYAADAVEVLSLMVATYLYVLCQALDLRVLHTEFIGDVRPKIDTITASALTAVPHEDREAMQVTIWQELLHHWQRTSTSDLHDRCMVATDCSVGVLLNLLPPSAGVSQEGIARQWKSSVCGTLQESYDTIRTRFLKNPTTMAHLCSASQNMYGFVRQHLRVPPHRGIVDHPTVSHKGALDKQCIGSQVSKLYAALRDGQFRDILLSCW